MLSDKTKKCILYSFAVFFLDQLTKFFITKNLAMGQMIHVNPFFDLVLLLNRGVSFGLFKSHGMLGVWLFSGIAIGMIAWLSLMISKTSKPVEYSAYALIIGGAFGNVVDRILYGGVVDFLYFHIKTYYWPAFNLADCAIVIGVSLIFITQLWQSSIRKSKKSFNPISKKRKK